MIAPACSSDAGAAADETNLRHQHQQQQRWRNQQLAPGERKVCDIPHEETRGVRVGCSSQELGREPVSTWINHRNLRRVASATPDLRLPSQPQGIAAPLARHHIKLLGDTGTYV